MKRLLPAYPLFVKDPYFSVWTQYDELNSGDTMFWTGAPRTTYGIVAVGNKRYSFLGRPFGAEPLKQTSIFLTAFSTDYRFECADFELEVSFVSPLRPDDFELLSCPVCFLDYKLTPKKPLKDLAVYLILGQDHCYDDPGKQVSGGVIKQNGFESAFFGLKRQLPLSHMGDSVSSEWGYHYLSAKEAFYFNYYALHSFLNGGIFESRIDGGGERFLAARDYYPEVLSPIRGQIMVAYDDCVSIFYFGEYLKGYYFSEGKTIFDALTYSRQNFIAIMKKLKEFDSELKKVAKPYGKDYLLLLYASLRQSVAAHKLVKNSAGEVLFLSKECHSNGCIATADVSYPSMPLYLLYAPELLKGMLRPIFRFASCDAWEYDFAPHDAGTYPYCFGQAYGRNERAGDRYTGDSLDGGLKHQTLPMIYQYPKGNNIYLYKYQMPVEECGNMLIMSVAAYLADGDKSLLASNKHLLKKWADYLIVHGAEPENQLCTDDFAGHLDKNINLSIKAVVAIYGYAVACQALGDSASHERYAKKAKSLAGMILKKATGNTLAGKTKTEKGVTPLVYGNEGENTFSLKYNLVFDSLLGANMFGTELKEKEVDFYISIKNKYGTPLDSRADYTKSDWILWSATLTESLEKRKKMFSPVASFLRSSSSRVPFSDWYDTKTGVSVGFQNRSVQGGIFMPVLADKFKNGIEKASDLLRKSKH